MRKEDYEQLLLEASDIGDVEKVRSIVREAGQHIDINCRDEFEDTPLILAASNGHLSMVQLLLDEGSEVNSTNGEGDSALISASERPGNAEVLKLLLDRGAEIDRKNKLGRTALIEASSIGDLQNVVLLLRHNPDLEVVTGEQETALTFAVVYEYLEIVKVLIAAGADVNWTDTNGWTPLTYAVHGKNEELVRLLIDAGADPDQITR